MSKLLISIFCAFSMSSALNENQILELLQLNSMFDVLHKNYDNQINLKWNIQKHNMKVINAQFLSMYGFAGQEIKDIHDIVMEELEAAMNITGPSTCFENLITIAYFAFMQTGFMNAGVVQNIKNSFNNISSRIFYPLVEKLHYESNTFQWKLLSALNDLNPISEIDELLQKLHDDYKEKILFYENAIENLKTEIEQTNIEFNQVRKLAHLNFEDNKTFYKTLMELNRPQFEGCLIPT